jgi:hypothetical protein
MEHHKGNKNKMDWPDPKTQWIREEYNRRKNRGKSPKRKAKGQIMGHIKKAHSKKY